MVVTLLQLIAPARGGRQGVSIDAPAAPAGGAVIRVGRNAAALELGIATRFAFDALVTLEHAAATVGPSPANIQRLMAMAGPSPPTLPESVVTFLHQHPTTQRSDDGQQATQLASAQLLQFSLAARGLLRELSAGDGSPIRASAVVIDMERPTAPPVCCLSTQRGTQANSTTLFTAASVPVSEPGPASVYADARETASLRRVIAAALAKSASGSNDAARAIVIEIYNATRRWESMTLVWVPASPAPHFQRSRVEILSVKRGLQYWQLMHTRQQVDGASACAVAAARRAVRASKVLRFIEAPLFGDIALRCKGRQTESPVQHQSPGVVVAGTASADAKDHAAALEVCLFLADIRDPRPDVVHEFQATTVAVRRAPKGTAMSVLNFSPLNMTQLSVRTGSTNQGPPAKGWMDSSSAASTTGDAGGTRDVIESNRDIWNAEIAARDGPATHAEEGDAAGPTCRGTALGESPVALSTVSNSAYLDEVDPPVDAVECTPTKREPHGHATNHDSEPSSIAFGDAGETPERVVARGREEPLMPTPFDIPILQDPIEDEAPPSPAAKEFGGADQDAAVARHHLLLSSLQSSRAADDLAVALLESRRRADYQDDLIASLRDEVEALAARAAQAELELHVQRLQLQEDHAAALQQVRAACRAQQSEAEEALRREIGALKAKLDVRTTDDRARENQAATESAAAMSVRKQCAAELEAMRARMADLRSQLASSQLREMQLERALSQAERSAPDLISRNAADGDHHATGRGHNSHDLELKCATERRRRKTAELRVLRLASQFSAARNEVGIIASGGIPLVGDVLEALRGAAADGPNAVPRPS